MGYAFLFHEYPCETIFLVFLSPHYRPTMLVVEAECLMVPFECFENALPSYYLHRNACPLEKPLWFVTHGADILLDQL